jgi:hypothetical protein
VAILDFIKDLEHSSLKDFWKISEHDDIPSKPGAYILVARGGSHFPYPRGKSPVFYIGQSSNLRKRLTEHLKYATQAKSDRKLNLYWPRYEFAAAYGGRYCYLITQQDISPKELEDLLLAKFAKKHFSFPIANGSGSWRRIEQVMGRV